MQKTNYFDGQDVLEEDLDNTEKSKSDEILRRGIDEARSFGIISNRPDDRLRPFSAVAFLIEITVGAAYDGNGEYINVPGPPEAPLPSVAFGPADVGKFVVLRYQAVQALAIAHPITGVLNQTRDNDTGTNRKRNPYAAPQYDPPGYTPGFQLLLVDVPSMQRTDVRLGKITAITGANLAILDVTPGKAPPMLPGHPDDTTIVRFHYSARVVGRNIFPPPLYVPGGNGFPFGVDSYDNPPTNTIPTDPFQLLVNHVNSFGSLGAPAAGNPHGLIPSDIGAASGITNIDQHQRDLHNTGIPGQASLTTLLPAINQASSPDQLTFSAILGGSSVVIDGKTFGAISGTTVITFADASGDPKLYEAYMNNSGQLFKNKIAEYTAPKPATMRGIQVIEVSKDHANVVGVDLKLRVVSATEKYVYWDNNSPAGEVRVVGPTLAPSGNYRLYRPNSILQSIVVHIETDTGALTDTPGTYTSTVSTFARVDRDLNFVAVNVPWEDSIEGGIIGLGLQTQVRSVWDQRIFGNISPTRLRDDAQKGDIERRWAETTGPSGTVRGGPATSPLANFVRVPEQVWYVGGKRVEKDRTTPDLAVPSSSTKFIYIKDDGTYVVDDGDPDIKYAGQNLTFRYAKVARAVVDGGGVVTLTDQRVDVAGYKLNKTGGTMTGAIRWFGDNVTPNGLPIELAQAIALHLSSFNGAAGSSPALRFTTGDGVTDYLFLKSGNGVYLVRNDASGNGGFLALQQNGFGARIDFLVPGNIYPHQLALDPTQRNIGSNSSPWVSGFFTAHVEALPDTGISSAFKDAFRFRNAVRSTLATMPVFLRDMHAANAQAVDISVPGIGIMAKFEADAPGPTQSNASVRWAVTSGGVADVVGMIVFNIDGVPHGAVVDQIALVIREADVGSVKVEVYKMDYAGGVQIYSALSAVATSAGATGVVKAFVVPLTGGSFEFNAGFSYHIAVRMETPAAAAAKTEVFIAQASYKMYFVGQPS